MATHTRIAVIGAGLIGPRHAQTVTEDPDAQLAAIVDPSPLGADLAAKFNVPYYTSVGHLINSDNKPDGAIICTPNHTHVAIGLELVRAGVHILVEKPISSDVESGQELVNAAENSGVKVVVGHHRRYNSYVISAKEIVDSGKLGEIVGINGLWTAYKPPDYFDPPAEWRRTRSGGVILINLIHEIDLMHYLCGPITRVFAEPVSSRRGFEAEEGAAITLKFKSGAVGSFLISDNVPSPHNFEAGTGENPLIPKVGKDFYRIFGTDATLSVPDLTIWSYNESSAKSWHEKMTTETAAVTEETPFKLQLSHFIRVTRGEQQPSCGGAAGLAAIVICNALKESIESALPVDIGTNHQ